MDKNIEVFHADVKNMQRQLAKAIKRARHLALMPFVAHN